MPEPPILIGHDHAQKVAEQWAVLHGCCKDRMGCYRVFAVADQPPHVGAHRLKAGSDELREPLRGRWTSCLKDVALYDGVDPARSIDLVEQQVGNTAALGQL
jgi:hypothetical protein